MPPANKTNFKTYEAQTRLLAAVIATNKGIKLDFKAIAAHIGREATASSVDHRLHPLKQLAKMQVAALAEKVDPGELPVEKNEIHKMYGESTPAGLEWQFRDIKKLAKAQQEAVNNGESPAGLLSNGGGGGATTPSSRGLNASTPGSRASKAGSARTSTPTPSSRSRGATGTKRKQTGAYANTTTSTFAVDDDLDDSEYDPRDPDETPTGRKKKQKQAKYPSASGAGAAPIAFTPAAAAKGRNGAGSGNGVITIDDEDIDDEIRAMGGGSACFQPIKNEPAATAAAEMDSIAAAGFFGNGGGHHDDDSYDRQDLDVAGGEA